MFHHICDNQCLYTYVQTANRQSGKKKQQNHSLCPTHNLIIPLRALQQNEKATLALKTIAQALIKDEHERVRAGNPLYESVLRAA